MFSQHIVVSNADFLLRKAFFWGKSTRESVLKSRQSAFKHRYPFPASQISFHFAVFLMYLYIGDIAFKKYYTG